MTIDVNSILNAASNFLESGKLADAAEKAIELFGDSSEGENAGKVDTKSIIWDCIEMVASQNGEAPQINEENFGQTANVITNLIGNAFGGNNEITADDAKAALSEVVTLLKDNGTISSSNYSKGLSAVTTAFNAYVSSGETGSVKEIAENFVDSIAKDSTILKLMEENGADVETVKKSATTATGNILSGVFSTGFKLLGNLFTGASDVLSGKSTIKDAAGNFLETSAQDVKNLGNTVTSNIGNFFNTAFGGIGKIAGGIFENVGEFIENSGIGDFLKDTVVSFAKTAIKNGVKNIGLIANPEAFIAKTLVDTVTDKQFIAGVTSNFANDVIAPNAGNETAEAVTNIAVKYGPQLLNLVQNFAANA